MRFRGGFSHTCRVVGVLLFALATSACSRPAQPPQQYGLSGGGPTTPGSSRDFSANVGDVVHFLEDSSALTGQSQATLRGQARWLNQYLQYGVIIQGHADERGTREYNLALGARRAMAVKGFLVRQGVNGARIKTISYGKERPIAVCDAPSCWSQNRRAQTVLNSGAIARY